MTAIGEMLRRERLKRNLELGQIAQELKISSRFLEAIEAGQLDKLPGGVFTKSFILQYARLLGLDEEEIAGRLQRILEPPPEVPTPIEAPKPVDSAIRVPRVEEWEAIGESRFRWSSSLSAAALVLVVMLACSGLYAWWQHTRRLAPAHETPPAAAVQTTPVPAPVEPPPSPVVQPSTAPTEAQPVAASPAPAPAPAPSMEQPTPSGPQGAPPPVLVAAVPAPNPNAAVRVELTAGEPVWVLARSDGKYLFSGTLGARESRTFEAASTVLLRLGNAGGVAIALNGKPVGPVGPRGQVRTVQFTSGGFEIVAVPKSPAPLDPR
jgi:cytoskeleton protein RodZ